MEAAGIVLDRDLDNKNNIRGLNINKYITYILSQHLNTKGRNSYVPCG